MEFFAPELDKHGYQALYKRKTNEVDFTLIICSISLSIYVSVFSSSVLFRSTMGTFKLLMAVQHFSVEIDLHMSKNMRLRSV